MANAVPKIKNNKTKPAKPVKDNTNPSTGYYGGTCSAMVVASPKNSKYVVAKDERGFYMTPKANVDNGILDPFRQYHHIQCKTADAVLTRIKKAKAH